jgi:hypothetical protein
VATDIFGTRTSFQDLLFGRLKIELVHLFSFALVVVRMDARRMDGYGTLERDVKRKLNIGIQLE